MNRSDTCSPFDTEATLEGCRYLQTLFRSDIQEVVIGRSRNEVMGQSGGVVMGRSGEVVMGRNGRVVMGRSGEVVMGRSGEGVTGRSGEVVMGRSGVEVMRRRIKEAVVNEPTYMIDTSTAIYRGLLDIGTDVHEFINPDNGIYVYKSYLSDYQSVTYMPSVFCMTDSDCFDETRKATTFERQLSASCLNGNSCIDFFTEMYKKLSCFQRVAMVMHETLNQAYNLIKTVMAKSSVSLPVYSFCSSLYQNLEEGASIYMEYGKGFGQRKLSSHIFTHGCVSYNAGITLCTTLIDDGVQRIEEEEVHPVREVREISERLAGTEREKENEADFIVMQDVCFQSDENGGNDCGHYTPRENVNKDAYLDCEVNSSCICLSTGVLPVNNEDINEEGQFMGSSREEVETNVEEDKNEEHTDVDEDETGVKYSDVITLGSTVPSSGQKHISSEEDVAIAHLSVSTRPDTEYDHSNPLNTVMLSPPLEDAFHRDLEKNSCLVVQDQTQHDEEEYRESLRKSLSALEIYSDEEEFSREPSTDPSRCPEIAKLRQEKHTNGQILISTEPAGHELFVAEVKMENDYVVAIEIATDDNAQSPGRCSQHDLPRNQLQDDISQRSSRTKYEEKGNEQSPDKQKNVEDSDANHGNDLTADDEIKDLTTLVSESLKPDIDALKNEISSTENGPSNYEITMSVIAEETRTKDHTYFQLAEAESTTEKSASDLGSESSYSRQKSSFRSYWSGAAQSKEIASLVESFDLHQSSMDLPELRNMLLYHCRVEDRTRHDKLHNFEHAQSEHNDLTRPQPQDRPTVAQRTPIGRTSKRAKYRCTRSRKKYTTQKIKHRETFVRKTVTNFFKRKRRRQIRRLRNTVCRYSRSVSFGNDLFVLPITQDGGNRVGVVDEHPSTQSDSSAHSPARGFTQRDGRPADISRPINESLVSPFGSSLSNGIVQPDVGGRRNEDGASTNTHVTASFTSSQTSRSDESSISSSLSDTTIFSSLSSLFSDLTSGSFASEEQLMHHEWNRILSFATFPQECLTSTTRLARGGWYYIGPQRTDRTKCFSCGGVHENWQRGEDPRAYHFPTCRFILGVSNDIPVSGTPSSGLSALANGFSHMNLHTAERPTSNLTEQHQTVVAQTSSGTEGLLPPVSHDLPEALRQVQHPQDDSLSSAPVPTPLPIAAQLPALAEASIARPHTASSNTSAAYVPNVSSPSELLQITALQNARQQNASVDQQIPQTTQQTGTQSTIDHSVHSTSQSATENTPHPPQPEDYTPDPLGISFDRPRYPSYAVLSVRVSSFQGWPSANSQTPREMAIAGFYYAGYGDYVRCFFCGGGLRNWEQGDDPWVEHARWFPRCAFVRQNRGEKFIQLVLRKAAEAAAEQKGEKSASASSSTSESTIDREMRSPAIQSIRDMGYAEDDIRKALTMLKRKLGPGKHRVTAHDILELLFSFAGTARNASPSRLAVTSGQSSATSTSMTQGQQSVSSLTSGLGNEGEDPKQKLSEAFGPSNEERQQSSESNVSGLQAASHAAQASGNLTLDEVRSLQEENNQLKEQIICKICMDNNVEVAFLPCGHLACCRECAPAMRKCPICREFVKGTVKTYLV